jgi:hypothetical protein
MVYVDIKSEVTRAIYDRLTIDESDIKISNISVIDKDNWGDDDCIKMVTTVDRIDILIEPSKAALFENVVDIQMIRYNYYQPAYHLNCRQESIEKQPDGSILLKYR